MRTKSQNEIKDKSQNEIKDKSQNEIEEKSQNEIKEKSQNEIKEKSQNEMRAKSDATKQSGMREAITPEESENLSFRTADMKKKKKKISCRSDRRSIGGDSFLFDVLRQGS